MSTVNFIFFDFFSDFFYFSLYLVILYEDRFLILFCFFCLFVSFIHFIFIYFFFFTVYGSSGTGGIETRGTARGMEGPAEAVPQRVTERNVSEAE